MSRTSTHHWRTLYIYKSDIELYYSIKKYNSKKSFDLIMLTTFYENLFDLDILSCPVQKWNGGRIFKDLTLCFDDKLNCFCNLNRIFRRIRGKETYSFQSKGRKEVTTSVDAVVMPDGVMRWNFDMIDMLGMKGYWEHDRNCQEDIEDFYSSATLVRCIRLSKFLIKLGSSLRRMAFSLSNLIVWMYV